MLFVSMDACSTRVIIHFNAVYMLNNTWYIVEVIIAIYLAFLLSFGSKTP